MSKELFREILEFRKYGNCLEELYKDYRDYLVEKVLEEITASKLADSFRSKVFEKDEINSLDATVNVINKFLKVDQNTKYHDGHEKIKPNGRTHLETNDGKFCTKEIFRKEFAKENLKINLICLRKILQEYC